jgi:hypothetical protein
MVRGGAAPPASPGGARVAMGLVNVQVDGAGKKISKKEANTTMRERERERESTGWPWAS